MAGTVVAVFADKASAHNAARQLIDNGVLVNDISVVVKESHDANDADQVHDPDHAVLVSSVREVDQHDVEEPHPSGSGSVGRAATGVTIGLSLGALIGSTLILVPGLGPLIAAGPLAALIGTSIAGGVAGGFVGALASDGIPEGAAQTYHDKVLAGKALVTVLMSADRAQAIEKLLEDCGGRQIGFYPGIIDSMESIES